MQTIALIDYGAGNVRSAERALLAAAALANRRREVRVTADPTFVARADRIVLPGQGAFGACMAGLAGKTGVLEALQEAVKRKGKPFLGICVGMQLLMCHGVEHGHTEGLGWLAGTCAPLDTAERLPHMGWNAAEVTRPHPVLDALAPAAHVYFAHSYAVRLEDPADAAAVTTHGVPFPAAVARENILGVQFHPEKSQAVGLALLARFVDWSP